MASGVYRTATVTVSVESVSEEKVRPPVLWEDCDPLTIPDEPGAGCAEDRGPVPFGVGFEEEEGLFPEAPGQPFGPVPDGGSDRQAPRLECPVAMFLEELETGQLECHAWDASGEEYLEYSWEPVGGTTRDYLDNPRLIPEDAPNPSVVAPETPVYETLESFRAGETTFRYRYRLTATSRATGLSSSSEVEVFVSSRRPSVYCPLEVVVEEGETVSLDCEGADPLSSRMDYDEEAASVRWEWEGLWGTSTDALEATHLSSPLFTAPPDSAGKEYHYIASMTTSASGTPRTARRRVTVTVTGAVLNKLAITVICEDPEDINEYASIVLECEASGAPGDDPVYTWSWSPTTNLTDHDTAMPTFALLADVDGDTTYTYTVTASADNVEDGTAEVTVTVKDVPVPVITCEDAEVFERTADFALNCAVENEPSGATYSWSGSGSTTDTSLLTSGTDSLTPTFGVPGYTPQNSDDVSREYQYTVALSVGSKVVVTENVTITVKDNNIICWRNYSETTRGKYSGTDEGGRTVEMETCSKITGPGPFSYSWESDFSWAASYISDANVYVPTFTPPNNVFESVGFFYRLTISSPIAPEILVSGGVWVYNTELECDSVQPVYEGSADFALDCSMIKFPVPGPSHRFDGPDYSYRWNARDDTPDISRLIADTDGFTPTFDVPDNVDANTDYEYKLTVSGTRGAQLHEGNVTVRVLKKPEIVIDCPGDPYSKYEGQNDITLDCEATGAPSNSEYDYAWAARGATQDTDNLRRKLTGQPRFRVPNEVNSNETYEYTLTVSAENAITATKDVTVRVLNKPDIVIDCPGNPYSKYEGEDDILLDCSASGAPEGSTYTYRWTARGNTPNVARLRNRSTPTPTFDVPDEVDNDEFYEYTLTVTAENAEDAEEDVTVIVWDKPEIIVTCSDSPYSVYEGEANFFLECRHDFFLDDITTVYEYKWAGRGSTSNTDQLIFGPNDNRPMFNVPANVERDEIYEYTVTVSAENQKDGMANVTVTVLNKPQLALVCMPPTPVYEGAENFDLDCSASGAPSGSGYDYVWTGRGNTAVPGRLSATDIASPRFHVPPDADADTDYEYTLTVTAENAEDATQDVIVTVLDKKPLEVACATPAPVFEGSPDVDMDCAATGAPPGSEIQYAWTARGGGNTDRLSSTTIENPTFDVPETVQAEETHEYTLTVSAENAEDATEEVTVRVLKLGSIALICASPPLVYEGSEDLALDCSVSGDTENTDYAYEWTPRGDTQGMSLLSNVNIASPTFRVPDTIAETTTYEYLLTARADGVRDATEEVSVTVLNRGTLAVGCVPPPLAYEGSEDFALDCEASGSPTGAGYAYEWTARGDTQDTNLLSDVNRLTPTFFVPHDVAATMSYEYLLTVSAENAESGSARVTVTVLNRGGLAVGCAPPPVVYEGAANFNLDCEASGAPAGSEYMYAWEARGNTPNTDLLIDGTDGPTPTFGVPDALDRATTYEYLLTASAENAEPGSEEVTVTVLDYGALSVTCADPPLVYEGSADFDLNCSASGAPEGSIPGYRWTPRGSTPNTALLSDATLPNPTFLVPDEVAETTTYEYLLTASADKVDDGSATVTVTVLKTGVLHVACTDPPPVYEGSEDFELDCSASGALAGSGYEYAWTVRGATPNTDLLSDAKRLTPTFYVPDDVPATTTYEYLLTVRSENAEDATEAVTVTVLNREMLSVTCPPPRSVYEGSEDFELDCSASGAPSGSDYAYAWTVRGDTQDTSLLSATDVAAPAFYVPDAIDVKTTYEYLLTVRAENAISGTAEVAVTVLNKPALAVTCVYPDSAYEGSEDIAFDCEASGAPSGSAYAYAWTAQGDTQDTSLLSDTHIATPVFYVPDAIDVTTTYEYLLTASAENAISRTAQVAVTVLNKPALAVTCADPASTYEGDEDIAFDCEASGTPSGSAYAYAWTAQGDTQDTSLLSATDIASPTFATPEEVAATTTYEYLLTVSAENAEDGLAEVAVTVLDELPLAFLDDAIAGRMYVFTVGETIEDILLPEATGGRSPYTYTLEPALPPGLSLTIDGDPARTIFGTPSEVRPRAEYAWQVTDAKAQTTQSAFFIEVVPVPPPPVAELLSLGVTVSASSLDFGVQSADTEVSLDPMTDRISTYVSGPYHRGRMTLAPDGSEPLDENGEMNLSIELASPVALRREGGGDAASIALAPNWSLAESCELLSSQTIGGLYMEATLSEDDCRLLRFGGELDLTDVLPGRYAGSMDLILRSGEREEMYSVEASVTVVPAQQVITIGPGGVHFNTSRESPAGLTEEQNLSIYPHVAFLTGETPHGAFELSNPSLVPLEVSVSARFGYTEATADGREVVVEDASGSRLGDLSEAVDIHPGVLVLMPGEKGLVRYGMKEGALAERGYAAFFDVVSQPRQYADRDQMPEETTGDRTARVTMRVPGVYVPAEGASRLRAALLSISFVGPTSATFLVETADHPFAGEVVAYDKDGRELGRRETLVYTRSRVRIPLDRIPEEGPVVLRFAPRGSDQAPEPVSIEWDVPGRDIGAAGNKDSATPPATLVRKP